MSTTNAALLDALADCLETGEPLPDALARVAAAGGAALGWAERIGRSLRADVPIAAALRRTELLDHAELALLSAEGADLVAPALLHALVLRRRGQVERRWAVLRGLIGPLGFAALTVVLDPLPNLVSGGPFVGPVLRGLALLVVLGVALFVGVPALLRHPTRRARALRLCAAIPGLHAFTALHAEEELVTVLVPFVEGRRINRQGLAAAAGLLAWSPLGEALRIASRADVPPQAPLPMGGLESLARHLSLATRLTLVGGVGSGRLAERLRQRGESLTPLLTRRLRLTAKGAAYALVLLFSVASLAGMVARGIPGLPTLPGGAGSADQKQLEELMKQLE